MVRKRYTEEQIIAVLREGQAGAKVADLCRKYGIKSLAYMFGTMIEIPRAAMTSDHIAQEAEFFSFGTNDLTQATFSFSGEDAENKFLPLYNQRKILQDNPFEVLDVKGVGRLMMIAIAVGLYAARGWNSTTALFPRVVGFPILALTIAILAVDIKKGGAHIKRQKELAM
jgi:phosphoenolpyruvate synthase/pyruvate phosphate dikinase